MGVLWSQLGVPPFLFLKDLEKHDLRNASRFKLHTHVICLQNHAHGWVARWNFKTRNAFFSFSGVLKCVSSASGTRNFLQTWYKKLPADMLKPQLESQSSLPLARVPGCRPPFVNL